MIKGKTDRLESEEGGMGKRERWRKEVGKRRRTEGKEEFVEV